MKGRDFLAEMAKRSHARAQLAQERETEAALLRRALATPVPPALELSEFDIIAELKLRSPAAGTLQDASFDKQSLIQAYVRAGACAVSVLTEPSEFHGELDDLVNVAKLLRDSGIPAMRKDFLTVPYQLLEARAAGAGGALVIVTMLNDATVTELLDCARELELFVLLEGFSQDDLQRIAALTDGADPNRILAGVNCRNLRDLQVDFDRFAGLSNALPEHLHCVAESGIASAENVRSIVAQGYRLALVGSALMTAAQPESALQAFIAAGRSAAAASECA